MTALAQHACRFHAADTTADDPHCFRYFDRFHNMPAALIVQDPDPVLVAGAIIMEIPMVDRLPEEFYETVKDGDTLLVNADEGFVEITE